MEAAKRQSSCNKNSKILAAASLFLCLTAIVIAVAAVLVVVYPVKRSERQDISLEDRENLHSMIVNNKTKRSIRNNIEARCYSNVSNDSLPVARISGKGTVWGTREPPRSGGILSTPGYQGKWSCDVNQGGAFIRGGMNFSEQEQRLTFPTCGYYYFSSQVTFHYSDQSSSTSNPKRSVQHSVEVNPNCELLDSYNRNAHSSLPLNVYTRTSTYIGDIVHACEGGSIKITVPTSGLCCARGDGSGTYLSAFLIQETDCQLP